MENLLDLSITLDDPPPGSSPETIASIRLSCDLLGFPPLGQGDVLIDLLTAKEQAGLRWYLEEYWKWPYEQFLERGRNIEELLTVLGKRLYRSIFSSIEARDILQAWRLYPEMPGLQRRISIISGIPRALSLPWELLHDEQGFLVLSPHFPISIVRRLPQRELPAFPTPFQPPLRILLITARPHDEGFIDPRSIARELLEEVQEQVEKGDLALEFLRPPTLLALRRRLSDSTRPPIHVLHFDGHGMFEQGKSKQGILVFEHEDGTSHPVQAEDLAQVLQKSGVKLIVLTACQSAQGTEEDAFSSVAARLIRSGVDAVAAMSASVLVVSAARYTEAFYHALASGISVPIAQERARQALHDDPRRHLHRRRANEEGSYVTLRDWWLPHYYQQRPVLLQRGKPARRRARAAALPRLSPGFPAAPYYSFSGRAYELLRIERALLHKKVVVIQGFGGIGKTALAREAADWLTRTQLYEGACFVSFEHGGDAAMLLSILGSYLGIYDGHYNPNDIAAALTQLELVLRQRKILLIADNLESILPNGEAPLALEDRTTLWNVFLDLVDKGGDLLLTSRDTSFGDARLAPGSRTVHLLLEGLHPDDSYALASRLLVDLGIDRARAPYEELRDLLAQLDHHPLAVQLVLPALRDPSLSLTTIRTSFATLLPRFVDETTTGRNRSLLASLEYSLRRLSPVHGAMLSRLSVFEGGAMEAELLEITQIPENEWRQLRPVLEQAALLTAERVHESISIPYLRFHPVLTPYLRNQSRADEAALHERYKQRYYQLIEILYTQDPFFPLPTREIVQRELPNLRRVLTLLLEAGEVDVASEMTDELAYFLHKFGLKRELSELRHRVEEAVDKQSKTQFRGALTWTEYSREIGRGEEELAGGDLRAAYDRFTRLLDGIEAQPAGTRLGRNSYEHCLILSLLAQCLMLGGQPAAAEAQIHEALAMIEGIIKEEPSSQIHNRTRGGLLADLGQVLSDQGKYSEAQEAFKMALDVAERQEDPRMQAVVQERLGTLVLRHGDYARARSYFTSALAHYHVLGEPASEAVVWHQLGLMEEQQNKWIEAESYYRKSLALEEQLGNIAGAASTCHHLANLAQEAGHPGEAEGWYKRTLELDEQIHPGSRDHAWTLGSLARLLTKEVQEGRAPATRLSVARGYAEQALTIEEPLGPSESFSRTLSNLAEIAELEGQTEVAQVYRRRESEVFAAYAGNHYRNSQKFRALFTAVAAGAKGDRQAQDRVETWVPELEAKGYHITAAIRRIWMGERDWHTLVEGLDNTDAQLIRLMLERLAEFPEK